MYKAMHSHAACGPGISTQVFLGVALLTPFPPFFLADNPQHCAALQHVPLSIPLPLPLPLLFQDEAFI
jgi:hypothetical protein